MEEKKFRSGFIPIIGRPNVGKSSAMNALIGEKVAIVSDKAQTTRNRIMGIVTTEQWQFVFLDTPGIHNPRTLLGEYMMHSVRDAMEGMDCILMLVDASCQHPKDLEIATSVCEKKVPKILAVNKTDLVAEEAVLKTIARFSDYGFDDIIPISAATGSGLRELSECIAAHLPEGPRYFTDDMMTDQPERLLCAEIIREKALRHLRDEIPHGIGVEILQIKETDHALTEIHATIYTEKESHKRIIIGKQGSMLRTIGTEARADIERLLGTHVNLKLWVKIRPGWRNSQSDLKTLGYDSKA